MKIFDIKDEGLLKVGPIDKMRIFINYIIEYQ